MIRVIETRHEVTSARICALRSEAATAGDLRQVVLCDRALTGEPPARRACAEAIESARAQE